MEFSTSAWIRFSGWLHYAFRNQLDLLDQLHVGGYRGSPQTRLEHGILLFQTDRPAEGNAVFRSLRQLWRESEHFVFVPERLRWLRSEIGELRSVRAVTGSDDGTRAMARVKEFAGALAAFRPEEHGMRDVRPQMPFVCHVSFGHNGPFLRPVTAKPHTSHS